MSDFDAWLGQAWDRHGDHADAVADELPVVAARLDAAAQLAPFAALATHVLGEHLGQWSRGIALLEALPSFDGSAAPTIARHRAVLRHLAGEPDALAALPPESTIAALAQVAAIAAGRDRPDQAIDAFRRALAAADAIDPPLADASPAIRALAVGGNNLAVSLEQQPARSADQTEAMRQAAEAGLRYWRRAGGWLEEERAHYRLARSQWSAGNALDACESARQCLAICAANDAPAFERFFGEAALALACRAAGDDAGFVAAREAARRHRDALEDEERGWCADDWALIADDPAAAGASGPSERA